MPRTGRTTIGGEYYHVFHRTAEHLQVFEDATDCWKFVDLMNAATQRVPIELLAACLMPNHFHFIVRPLRGADLGRWMHWLLTTHVRRWHAQQHTNGQVWQGRFKASSIAPDGHLLSVMRYVESNALRNRLVDRAENWPWSSLAWRNQSTPPLVLTSPPVPLMQDWTERVNQPQSHEELSLIREALGKQRRYGDPPGVS